MREVRIPNTRGSQWGTVEDDLAEKGVQVAYQRMRIQMFALETEAESDLEVEVEVLLDECLCENVQTV